LTLTTRIIPENECESNTNSVSEEVVCRSKYARTHFILNKSTGELVALNCKSWKCPVHGENYIRKWQAVLAHEVDRNPIDFFLTLTTASECTHEQLYSAKVMFFRSVREWLKSHKLSSNWEYFSSLEFQTKSQFAHLHILIRGTEIPLSEIRAIWSRCSASVGMAVASQVDCQKPRNQYAVAKYAVKFAFNQVGELAKKIDQWRGRKVTYSRHFFSGKVADIWQSIITSWGYGDRSLTPNTLMQREPASGGAADRQIIEFVEFAVRTRNKLRDLGGSKRQFVGENSSRTPENERELHELHEMYELWGISSDFHELDK
jgi:hypothetical protein